MLTTASTLDTARPQSSNRERESDGFVTQGDRNLPPTPNPRPSVCFNPTLMGLHFLEIDRVLDESSIE